MRSEYHSLGLSKSLNDFVDKVLSSETKIEHIETIIHAYGKEGIRHQALASIVGITGKWLRHYTQELIKKGRIKRVGIKGPYFPVYDIYGDPIIDAELFGGNFESLFFSKMPNQLAFNQSLGYPIRDLNGKYNLKDFSSTKKYFEINFTMKDIMEYKLFEFANRIGAFTIYTIIQAMNPDNFYKSSPAVQNQLSHKYIEQSISKITATLAQRFRQFFTGLVRTYYVGSQEAPNDFMARYDPILLYDKESIKKLLTSFSNIYPLLTLEFERIRGKPYIFKNFIESISSSSIQRYKKKMEHLQRGLELQKSCKHVFKKSVRVFHGHAKQCKKCMYTERVKKSN